MYDFFVKIGFCVILSGLLGLERQYHYKMVGIRTNVLVALGSFLFVYLAFSQFSGDQLRIAASVVTGIGFLGAGVIIQNGNKIIGIDTAATLWCVASIGVLCAGGLLFEATVGSLLILSSNFILRSWSHNKKKNNFVYYKCSIKISCNEKAEKKVRTLVTDSINKENLGLESFEKTYTNKGTTHLNFVFISKDTSIFDNIVNSLSEHDGVSKISWSHEKDNSDIIQE